MRTELDFNGLASALLSRSKDLLPRWFPQGKWQGKEYLIGNLNGEPGKSLSIDSDTGMWCDFAGSDDERGRDLTSLYAKHRRIGMGEAFHELAEEVGIRPLAVVDYHERKPNGEYYPAPLDAAPPDSPKSETGRWKYTTQDGRVWMWVIRWTQEDGEKSYLPKKWDHGSWVNGQPARRIPYNLADVVKYPTRPVLVVEGEKASDSGQRLVGERYVVTTWAGGSKSVSKTDWSSLDGRRVLILPDNDEPGVKAANDLAKLLTGKAAQVKVIDVAGGGELKEGWDLADAEKDGWDWTVFYQWAVPLAKVYSEVVEAPPAPPKRDPEKAATTQLPPEEVEKMQRWVDLGIRVSKTGSPTVNEETVVAVCQTTKTWTGKVWFDGFFNSILMCDENGNHREWGQKDTSGMLYYLQHNLSLSAMTEATVVKGVLMYAHMHDRNELVDWVEGLKWDGVERCSDFLVDVFECDRNEYTTAASRNFWVSMIARVKRPGCQVDNMLIVEGDQGIRKTTALRAIGGKWFAEISETVGTADFLQTLHGKLLVELGELSAFSKAESAHIKSMLTRTYDRFRPPYARAPSDFPRQCIFVGTTNKKRYLRDNTGNRRFWPIEARAVNVDYIVQQRDQLFAEALSRFSRGEKWYEMPTELTNAAQEGRREVDAWEEVMSNYLINKTETTMVEIASEALKMETSRMDSMAMRRICEILQLFGWKSENMRGSRKYVRWFKPSPEQTEMPETN